MCFSNLLFQIHVSLKPNYSDVKEVTVVQMTRDMRCPTRFCVYERDTDILSLHEVWNDKAGKFWQVQALLR